MKSEINILIVDDQIKNLDTFRKVLKRDDVNILTAQSGKQALEYLIDHKVAVAILDVKMPEMSGFELAELMRGKKSTQKIPIIFVTGVHRDQRFIFKGYELGAVDYLLTPVEPIVLQGKINFFLDNYKNKVELEKINNSLEELVAQRSRELIQKNEDLEHFTHIAAHDLKEPLGQMKNIVEIIKSLDFESENKQRNKMMEMLDRSCNQMVALVYSFRELTKIGKPGMQREEVKLKGLIDEVINNLGIMKDKAEFKFEISSESIFVYKILAYQLYLNLIKNAIGHSKNENPLVIFTEEIGEDDHKILGVKSFGSTIPVDKRQKVFQIFEKLEKSSGSGIGLSLCKRIVEHHQGKIWIEGEDDFVHMKFILDGGSK
ncbi:MAG: response regulator [Bdellovibrionota bacterium]